MMALFHNYGLWLELPIGLIGFVMVFSGHRSTGFSMFITGLATACLTLPQVTTITPFAFIGSADDFTTFEICTRCLGGFLLGLLFCHLTRVGAVALAYWSGFCIAMIYVEGSTGI